MRGKMKNVLVALEFYRSPLFEGIAEYARSHHWHLSLEMLHNPGAIPWGWDGDGILTMLIRDESALLKFLRTCKKPTVNLEGRLLTTSYPRVLSDTQKAAEMAFRYFRSKGFENFAFYGVEHSVRGRDFARVTQENGFPCGVLYEGAISWREELEATRRWLKVQPKPLAVLCWADYAGARFVDMAHSLGWRIPDDVAVLGMDNEELICDCAAVRLSSLRTDIQRVGTLGAALLDRLMAGETPRNQSRLIPPLEIVERHSTDTFAVDSPLVAQAVRFMKEQHPSGINVADVVASCSVSRRGLEKAFLASLGHSPYRTLLQIRMDRARILLRSGHEKIATVARSVGLPDPKHFSSLFRQECGLSPRDYRQGWHPTPP
jgi:LacI family transcriptional regulator